MIIGTIIKDYLVYLLYSYLLIIGKIIKGYLVYLLCVLPIDYRQDL